MSILLAQNTKKKPLIVNISDSPTRINFDLAGMTKLIILPDYSPGRGNLPVGTVAVFDRREHLPSGEYIGPDMGCGMLLAKFRIKPLKNIEHLVYQVVEELTSTSSPMGSLGAGNHFINIYQAEDSQIPQLSSGEHVVLIHSGSREFGTNAYQKRLTGNGYLSIYKEAAMFGARNRMALLDIIEECAGDLCETLVEKAHNSVEVDGDKIVYRKGAMKLMPGQIGVIPSHMGGEAVVVRAKPEIAELEYSINHGTGRVISRSKAKEMHFDFTDLRKKVYIPNRLTDEDILTEAPNCYRSLAAIEPRIGKYVEIVARLNPIACAS